MRALFWGTYYQILNLLRVKKAVFFSFIFPAFLFVLFSFIWGNGNLFYSKYILTGVIVLTIASDAIFSIGAVISGYYTTNQIKFLRVLPQNILFHLFVLVLSRLILIYTATIFLLLIGILLFGIQFSLNEYFLMSLSVILGTILFSFIGMFLAGLTKENSQNSSITNMCFYAMLFLSNTFYSITNIYPNMSKFSYLNPFNIVLDLMRETDSIVYALFSSFVWMFVLIIIVVYQYSKLQIKR
ncbi:ABC transporter permease [Bacteroides sp. KG156]|uniref:ABC transporter permease n=1 Tax=unclassified Bacteroides TaxID=2646097 RepID=UPI003D96BA99